MTVLEALLLGIVQGLTEFLPVSSSGHLALLAQLFDWQEPRRGLAFSVVVHLGTLLAVVVAYRRSLVEIARSRRRALVPLAIATAPLVLALPLAGLVERAGESPLALALAFWATAALLLVADRPGRPPPAAPAGEEEPERLEDVPPRRALVVGFAQLLAVLPGVSRSGATIGAGLVQGTRPELAAQLAFLMAIPAILGAALAEARAIGELAGADPAPLVAGFAAALVTGLGAIHVLRWLLRIGRFWVFAPYLAVLGVVTLVWA